MVYSIGKAATTAAVAMVLATTAPALTAAAESGADAKPSAKACTNLYMGSGHVHLCKTWSWDGNDYDGRWWNEGPSDLPGGSYLQRREDGGRPIDSPWRGSYQDRDEVVFRVCNDLLGCGGWW
ncbi:hypothetical protein A8924_5011 [Saccharopolyspora erythraea NRRL 2338]|uniref:Uncharacterized protein n=2 Tax=Saccharopolyspora erythraea TaxID=1836 RepID=A4FIL8_SACEN|nr:hypothetical protein [Saccharopolyspora erythraea]EQD87890.1 hypothetical protein N599_01895 [Saccharopolyspora erythraea D]PFG97569.1 hypothetical protein A8924_5011 [Saccharopolyspora erythraea NRRL 2338]QRK87736.1 hypothetical protein JQX30_23545 [Saccharopolyspora erythraea]CAM03893.1 hypothetical protein SACE_4624 [Saccharopolyspora erythraea NRRL 2338]